MVFIKLVRALGIGLAAGLACHLLYSACKKNVAARQRGQTGSTRRKYVESSVIEKKDQAPDKEES